LSATVDKFEKFLDVMMQKFAPKKAEPGKNEPGSEQISNEYYGYYRPFRGSFRGIGRGRGRGFRWG
jgi:hypothetical protein